MKIAIAADHGGFALKQKIIETYAAKGSQFEDWGTDSEASVDYPDYAEKVCRAILEHKADLGILICGSGIGISIAANRRKGIRAALLYSDEVAALARKHNNANIAVFGGRTMAEADALRRVQIFLDTEFEGGRHIRRIEKLDVYGEC